jgi:colanic acid biosynthesis glycosyl transferase WcaI
MTSNGRTGRVGLDVKKRIVFYTVNYAPEMTGPGRYAGEIGEYFAALGHDVFVITTPPHYPEWKAHPPYSPSRWTKEIIAGATVYRCPTWLSPNMKGIKRLISPLSFALSSAPVALWQILARRPDVVIAVEPTLFVAPISLLGAKLVGARSVLHIQDLEVDAAFAVGHLRGGGLMRRVAGAVERWLVVGFDRVITISNRMAERIIKKGVRADRIEIVRNWVDLDHIRPVPSSDSYRMELGLPRDAFIVLYAGNIGAKQGVRILIEAARELSDRPDIIIVVAGQGPMRPEVERAASKLANLKVLDFQPESRFGEFLGLADVHVLPQERDVADLLFPSKLGGMLASGRPIAVTADAGTELADFLGESCTLTPPGDAAALAQAIIKLASEPPSKSQEAQRLVLARSLSKRVNIHDFGDAALFSQTSPGSGASRVSAGA